MTTLDEIGERLVLRTSHVKRNVFVEAGSLIRGERRLQLPKFRSGASPQLFRPHSIRNAFMGEMEAARFAGIMAATKEHSVSAQVATVNAGGSHQDTPYN